MYVEYVKNKKVKPSEGMSISCYLESINTLISSSWIIGISASSHVCNNLHELMAIRSCMKVIFCNGAMVVVVAVGYVILYINNNVLFLDNICIY